MQVCCVMEPFFPSTYVLAYAIPYLKSLRRGPVVDFVVFLDVLNLPRYGLGMSIFVILVNFSSCLDGSDCCVLMVMYSMWSLSIC